MTRVTPYPRDTNWLARGHNDGYARFTVGLWVNVPDVEHRSWLAVFQRAGVELEQTGRVHGFGAAASAVVEGADAESEVRVAPVTFSSDELVSAHSTGEPLDPELVARAVKLRISEETLTVAVDEAFQSRLRVGHLGQRSVMVDNWQRIRARQMANFRTSGDSETPGDTDRLDKSV